MKISEFINGNLWAILFGLMTVWNGYLVGQATTKAKIDQIEADVARNSGDIKQLQSQAATTGATLNTIGSDVRDIKTRFELLVPTSSLKREDKQ